MLVKEAENIVGGLSNPSKMPGYSYNIPALECNVGGALFKIKGSVCFKCYARKGRYVFKSTIDAMYRRLESLKNPMWVKAMSFLINRYSKKYTYFRWHDSGDLQSRQHLDMIMDVCRETPKVKHWLPTKEIHLISKFSKSDIPSNLCIRPSAFYIGEKPRKHLPQFPFSTVHSKGKEALEGAKPCLSYRTFKNGEMLSQKEYKDLPKVHGLDLGHCGNCRACWDKDVEWVSYAEH